MKPTAAQRAGAVAKASRAPNRAADRRLSLLWLALALMTAATWQLCFAPLDMAGLAYLTLVPWGLAVILPSGRRTALAWGWATGIFTMAAGLYWLTWITLLGYALLTLYMSFYWLAAAWFVRRAAVQRRPLWLVLPIIWTALEFIRGTFASGFPWFSLAHSQYRWTVLVQIADVTGPYGVTFFVAMVNGLILDLVVRRKSLTRDGRWWTAPAGIFRAVPAGWAATVLVAAALVGYGTFRLWQADRPTDSVTHPGPRIGVVQGAFPISLFHLQDSEETIFREYLRLTGHLPLKDLDLVVWPESMLPSILLDEEYNGELPAILKYADEDSNFAKTFVTWRDQGRQELGQLLGSAHIKLLTGAQTVRPGIDTMGHPVWDRFNSAILVTADPNGKLAFGPTYDKMHCVPASEYVPFREGWPALHDLLRKLVPDSMPQLTPGKMVRRFQLGSPQEPWTAATPICYEGVFPNVCRELMFGRPDIAGRAADVMINMSNDGWFIAQLPNQQWASTELDQHLAGYVFRAVESRRPVVRAVNTGISGFVDSSGRIGPLVQHEQTGQTKMITGTASAQVLVDTRRSLYSLIGDFPAWLCVTAGAVTLLMLWRPRRAKPQKE